MCLKVVSYLIRHTLKKDRNHWKFLLNIKLHFYFGMVHSTHCGPTDKETFQKQLKMKGTLPWTRSVSQSFTVSQPKLQAAFIKQGADTPVSLWFNLPWDVKQSNKTPLCETGPRKSNPRAVCWSKLLQTIYNAQQLSQPLETNGIENDAAFTSLWVFLF